MELGLEISKKVVETVNDYAEKTGINPKVFFKKKYEFSKRGELLLQILSFDVACYALFHLAYIDGSHHDNLKEIRRKYINEYEKEFGEYNDVNANAY